MQTVVQFDSQGMGRGLDDWQEVLDMEPLWDWESDRGANEDDLAPVHSMESKATEKLAVVN